VLVPSQKSPTARHVPVGVHATPDSPLIFVPAGLGVLCKLRRVLFQQDLGGAERADAVQSCMSVTEALILVGAGADRQVTWLLAGKPTRLHCSSPIASKMSDL
jgi:hypothetical protein